MRQLKIWAGFRLPLLRLSRWGSTDSQFTLIAGGWGHRHLAGPARELKHSGQRHTVDVMADHQAQRGGLAQLASGHGVGRKPFFSVQAATPTNSTMHRPYKSPQDRFWADDFDVALDQWTSAPMARCHAYCPFFVFFIPSV